ncbi:helix-turn-helix domain-containing protein [Gordonia sp. (in: high G+C Gram-positive bacteria)]|uniref:helix-turn-helix domain-containing protein n=1 Tax=Gordonia sp. (in: high G+C Gram-positive bacteria) TaxID=84139 RepID=UPI003C75B08E
MSDRLRERGNQVARMTAAGMSAAQIAEQLEVSPRTVARWRTRIGINVRPAAKALTGEQHATARRLIEDGCSLAEVARTIGCSSSVLGRWYPEAAWSRSECSMYRLMLRSGRRAVASCRG